MEDSDPDAFWELVRTNLAAGKLRLVIVADEIPSELARIVKFLNEQMATTEVIALEVKQYVEEGGQRQTLVPRIVGRTQAARDAKDTSRSPRFKTIDDLKAHVRDETIRSWIDSVPKRLRELFPDSEVRLAIPGTGDGSFRVDGKTRLGWWYSQRHLYAWTEERFEGDEVLLKSRLSRPAQVKTKEDYREWDYGIRFHVKNDADMKVFEDVARRLYEQASG